MKELYPTSQESCQPEGRVKYVVLRGEKKHQHRILLQIHPSRGEIKTMKN